MEHFKEMILITELQSEVRLIDLFGENLKRYVRIHPFFAFAVSEIPPFIMSSDCNTFTLSCLLQFSYLSIAFPEPRKVAETNALHPFAPPYHVFL